MLEDHPARRFTWISTDQHTVTATRVHTQDYSVHDAAVHHRNTANASWFCAPATVVTALDLLPEHLNVTWEEVPYCQLHQPGNTSIGWNFAVTINDGTHVVVTKRHPTLSSGGKWHLSANESAAPGDFPDEDGTGQLASGKIAARALKEELGIPVTADQAEAITQNIGLFRIGRGLGYFMHVRGEQLGWTEDYINSCHAHAVDGWEGAPHVVPLATGALLRLAPPEGWTAWSLPCLTHLAERQQHDRN